jgi:hypothetical protein
VNFSCFVAVVVVVLLVVVVLDDGSFNIDSSPAAAAVPTVVFAAIAAVAIVVPGRTLDASCLQLPLRSAEIDVRDGVVVDVIGSCCDL